MKKQNKIIQNISDIPCIILCGGKGTRLRDVTEQLPKPMVPIGDYPIVLHIMKWYAKFGVKRFILCLGYKKECFIQYFTNFYMNNNDITIDLSTNDIQIHDNDKNLDWKITLVDTGLETKTAKRLQIVSKYLLKTDKYLFLTYGDGVSNIDINELYKEHVSSRKLLTLTAVLNPTRFGLIEFSENNDIIQFNEKNVADGYINGGYMCISKQFLTTYIDSSDVFLEKEPLTKAMNDNNVHAYIHNGFWQCMDNSKEYQYLTEQWNSGNAPWK